MAVGYTAYTANKLLDAAFNATSFSVTTPYLKLHTGTNPGPSGATGAATNATRQTVSFGVAASGAIENDVAVTWTSVSTTENYQSFSLWDASTAGNCLWTGTLTGGSVTAGNDFTIAIGALDLSMTVAS